MSSAEQEQEPEVRRQTVLCFLEYLHEQTDEILEEVTGTHFMELLSKFKLSADPNVIKEKYLSAIKSNVMADLKIIFEDFIESDLPDRHIPDYVKKYPYIDPDTLEGLVNKKLNEQLMKKVEALDEETARIESLLKEKADIIKKQQQGLIAVQNNHCRSGNSSKET